MERVRPSGLFLAVQNNPVGSFVTEIPSDYYRHYYYYLLLVSSKHDSLGRTHSGEATQLAELDSEVERLTDDCLVPALLTGDD